MTTRREFLKLTAAGALSLFTASLSPFFDEDLSYPSPEPNTPRKNQGVLGIMPNFGWKDETQTWDEKFEIVRGFEDTLDRKVQLISLFADMQNNVPDPRAIEHVLSSGRGMMINLMPRPTKIIRTNAHQFAPQSFANGMHDEVIKKIARDIQQFGDDYIFIRFAFEMNGDWFLWHTNPSIYVNMWRHVVDIFRSEGTHNAKWVFSPNNFPNPEDIDRYYPGSDYVDAVGPDIYRWSKTKPSEDANRIFYYLKKAAPKKPLMITEFGATEISKENEVLPERDDWLTDLLELGLSYGSTLFTYFDFKKKESDGNIYDWRLRNPSRIKRLRRLVNSDKFLSEAASLQEINKAILSTN